MKKTLELETPRLLLRQWREKDIDGYHQMGQDARVMEFFPKLQDREDCEKMVQRFNEHFEKNGYGFWAAENKATGKVIGPIGLNIPTFEAAFNPSVEIGWRLNYESWGNGFATEGAERVLKFAFEELDEDRIVAFTAPGNVKSQNVMKRIGMKHLSEYDFDHPSIAAGHPLRRHAYYQILRSEK